MKKNIKQKKGISLIVLVITIVVMIILATVVILSLDSSNIIERANEAKEATNLANLKEAASVALAEYKLEVSLGNLDESSISANDYVKNKLEEQGMNASTMAISKDGKVITGLSKVAAKFVGAGIEVGAQVTGYTLNSADNAKKVNTDGNENTCSSNYEETTPQAVSNIARDESITWSYMGIDENGNALIVGSVSSSSPKLKIGGKGGYLNGVNTLDTICKTMYTTDMGIARSIKYEDVLRVLNYTGPKGMYQDPQSYASIYTYEPLTVGEIEEKCGKSFVARTTPDGKDLATYIANQVDIQKNSTDINAGSIEKALIYQNITYWLSSSCNAPYYSDFAVFFNIRYVSSSKLDSAHVTYSAGYPDFSEYAMRPVVELNENINMTVNANGSVTLNK